MEKEMSTEKTKKIWGMPLAYPRFFKFVRKVLLAGVTAIARPAGIGLCLSHNAYVKFLPICSAANRIAAVPDQLRIQQVTRHGRDTHQLKRKGIYPKKTEMSTPNCKK